MRFAVVGILACLAVVTAAAADEVTDPVRAYVAAHQKEIVGQLADLTRFHSVFAEPKGIQQAADWLEAQLKRRGFAVEQLRAPGGPAPVVFGSLTVPGAKRTVVFYAHYDGQPVTPSEWASDPFTPVMRSGPLHSGEHEVDWKNAATLDPEWRLFARATSDDKASEIAFLAAFDALTASGRKPSVNLKVIWEGEEEAGSPHLTAILRANAEKLRGDLLLIGDGPVHQSRKPMLAFGARGVVSVEMTIYGPVRALHDGHYGNWVPNPAAMAAELTASMRAPDGRILIPHFLDDVRPLSAAEKAAIVALPDVDEALRREYGIARSETGESVAAAIMRPALNVRGIRSGHVGDEAANAIPITADVSIDFRLVPNQTPEHVRTQLENFLRAQGWTVVATEPDAATRATHSRIVKLEWADGYPAFRSDMTTPAVRAVIAAANNAAGSEVALLPMMGGSVPIYMFDEMFHAPIVNLPIANHDNSQHAANENIRLQNIWDGIAVYASLMAELDW